MTANEERALVIAHAAVADRVVPWLARLGRSPEACDLLLLGSAAPGVPTPDGMRRIGLRAVAARGATEAVVLWPALRRSAIRGALGGIALASGATSIRLVDVPPDPAPEVVSQPGRALIALDAASWLGFSAVSGGIAAVAWAGLRAAACRPTASTLPDSGGAVLYLRSDLELTRAAGAPSGGAAAHTAGVVHALSRRRPVRIASTGPVGVDDERAFRLPVVAPPNLNAEVAELLSGLVQAVVLLRRCERPALVYQRYSLNNLAGAIAASRWRVPLVLEANASEAGWRRHWGTLRLGPLADAAERFLLRRADRIAAVSEVVARDLVAAGAPADRVVVVPNAADWETFARSEPASLPFPAASFVVAFAGSFYPWHGAPFLAEAFVRLVREWPDSRLLLIGDGTARAVTMGVLERAGVADRVHATGLVDRGRVPALLAAADVLVSPHAAWRDFIGSPVKVFEYMAAGRAIVATRVGQIGEVLRDRQTALLVEPSNPDALYRALVELHDDPGLRTALGQAASEEARLEHSWDARVDAILAPG